MIVYEKKKQKDCDYSNKEKTSQVDIINFLIDRYR